MQRFQLCSNLIWCTIVVDTVTLTAAPKQPRWVAGT
jgi:hypothetical protein